jgi:general secretion pathway protein A
VSGGVPRVINLLCDRALMAAFSAHAREVTPALVRAAARNLEGRGGARRRRAFASQWPALRRLATAAGLAGLVALAAVAGMTWVPGRTLSGAATATPAPVALLSAPAPAVARLEPAPAVPPVPSAPADAPAVEPLRALLARLLKLWGVGEELAPAVLAAWPTLPGGALDIAAVAERYHLAATFLPDSTLGEIRAVGLPVLVGVGERGAADAYLLRRMDRDAALLVSGAGEERRLPLERLESAWTRSAWVIWRNVDLLPVDPATQMTPTVSATVSLRLAKLGFPADRLDVAVRRFQRANGLEEDGIMGPRTTLALARATAGPFGPSLAPPSR